MRQYGFCISLKAVPIRFGSRVRADEGVEGREQLYDDNTESMIEAVRVLI